MIRILLCCVLYLAIGVSAAAQVELETATGLKVQDIEIVNPTSVTNQEIRRLFLLEPGESYSPEAVQRSLHLLARKVEIRNVRVRGRRDGESLVLTLTVEAAPLVYSIAFRGEGPVEEDKLRSALRTRIDRAVRESDLTKDRSALLQVMEREGFPRAKVEVQRRPMRDSQWVRIVFLIDGGEPRRIRRIEVPSEVPVEPWRLRALLGLEEGDPASESQLRSGVKRLEDVLRQRSFGYPETEVRRARFEKTENGSVLVLPLHTGEHTNIRIVGVDEWQARHLYPVYKSRFGETIDHAWLDGVADGMEEELQNRGYETAQVAWEIAWEGDTRRITFHVDPGVRVYVEEVVFSGNRNLSSGRLENYMSVLVGGFPLSRPPFTEEALQRDLKALNDYYASKGYLDARVAVLERKRTESGEIRLHIHVDEGASYRYGEIRFQGEVELEDDALREIAGLRTGRRADPGALVRARSNLQEALAARGRSRAEVRYETDRTHRTGEVDVVFEIVGGPTESVGRIIVSGNVRTRTHVILRELTFDTGDLWNPEEIARSRRRIYRLGFFRSVRIDPVPAALEGGRRDVVITVEEQDAGSIKFGFGYGTEEGIKGSASVGHANLFGTGRSLNFRMQFDAFDESYAVNFREPWLFHRPLDLRLSLVKAFQDREAYNLNSLGFQPALEKEFSERFRGSLLYTLEQNRLSSVRDPDVVDDENLNDYLLSSIGPVLAFDSRDDPFNPRWGMYHTMKVEWALEDLGSEVRFNRYSGSLSGFASFGEHTLGLYAGGGIARRFGETVELPLNKRFFLGGRDTVRGYARDEIGPTGRDGTPVGGDVMLNGKAEWRYPLWRSLRGVLFWDAGNVWSRADETPDYYQLRHGVGIGLRYVTPVGPLSLDWARKLRPRDGESPFRIHFTVGNVF